MATMTPLPQLQPMADPMEQYGRVVALKSMLQQQQMQQQQMAYQQQMQPLQLQAEQSAIRTQQLQQSLLENKVNDDKMMTDLWQQNGGDLDKLQTAVLAPDSKISAQGKLGFIQQRYELQKMHNQTSDEEAQLMKHTNEVAGPMLSQMSSASDEELPKQVATYNSTVAANPSLAKYMPPVPQGLDPTGTRNWVKNQQAAHTTYEQLDKDRDYNLKAGPLSNEKSANDNASFLQRLRTMDPNATLPPNLTMTPGKSTVVDEKFADEQIKQMEASATQRMDATYQQSKALDLRGLLPHDSPQYADMMAYEARKKLVPMATTALRISGMGEIREYPVYDTRAKSVVMATPNEINRASLQEPGRYTAAAYTPEAQIQAATGKAFAPGGKGGEEMLAFGTALSHGQLLKAAYNNLQNGDLVAANKLGAQLGIQFGSDAATNYQTIADVYGREVNKALTAGHITDKEIETIGKTIPVGASPEQFSGTLNAYQSLMGSKYALRQQQFEAGRKGELPPAPSQAGAGYKVGDKVRIKGKDLTVTAVHPNGSFDAK